MISAKGRLSRDRIGVDRKVFHDLLEEYPPVLHQCRNEDGGHCIMRSMSAFVHSKSCKFTRMKGFVYLWLLLFSVGAWLPRYDFGQLTKVGDLLLHFEEHRAEALSQDQSLSLEQFLRMHFIQQDPAHEDRDAHKHSDLPFQNISTSIVLFVVGPPAWSAPLPVVHKRIVERVPQVLSYDFSRFIFRPPSRA